MSIPVILIIVQINSLCLPALNYGCKKYNNYFKKNNKSKDYLKNLSMYYL